MNEISLIQYTIKNKIHCNICGKALDYIEIINEKNKGVCSECLYKEIEQCLLKRIKFIKDDIKTNYINYSYYLRPIELFLQEPLSVKDGIENNSILIKNIDYYLLYQKTFSEKIKELLLSDDKESLDSNIINTNKIINEINSEEKACIMCSKTENVLLSSCGCNFCDDCIYTIIGGITDSQIILNGYEKKLLYEQNLDKCPICEQKVSINYLIMLLQEQGRNFENEIEEAIIRMANYCNTTCFNCEKKFENENFVEVEHNKKRIFLKLNVMINKHCLKDVKNKNINNEIELQNGIDYNDSQHCICMPCYKKIKIKRTKVIQEVNYKVVGCNICGINHLIKESEWNKYNKSDVCCKCFIF